MMNRDLILFVLSSLLVVQARTGGSGNSNFVSFGKLHLGSSPPQPFVGRRRISSLSSSSTACYNDDDEAMLFLNSGRHDDDDEGDDLFAVAEVSTATMKRPTRSRGYQKKTSSSTSISFDDGGMTVSLPTRLLGITKPIMPVDVWRSLTGREFQDHPDRLDGLCQTGAQLAGDSNQLNDWITWKVHTGKTKVPSMDKLESGQVHVWTGRPRKKGFGSHIPFIKTRSIIPLSVEEMVDLLMDSNRVKTYNQWSLGRKDMWTSKNSKKGGKQTKIVKNRVKPPIGNKNMISTTMIHARPMKNKKDWIVVSRAIGGNMYDVPADDKCGRSNIMLGVNLLQPHGDNGESCILTAVTHVYSAAMPVMLAERLGVKSAINFVKDMRKLKE